MRQFRIARDSSVSVQLAQLLNASALRWFEAIASRRNATKLAQLFPENLFEVYSASLRHLNRLLRRSFAVAETANALHCVFFCIAENIPASTTSSVAKRITTARELHEIEAAQYYISLLRRCEPIQLFSDFEPIQPFSDFEQIQLLYEDNPNRAVALLERNLERLTLTPGRVSKERCDKFNLKVMFTRAAWATETASRASDDAVEILNNVIKNANEIESTKIAAAAHFTLAKFFRNLHTQICNEFQSEEFSTICKIIAGNESQDTQQLVTFRRLYTQTVSQQRMRFSNMITGAIEHYLAALSLTSEFDIEAMFSMFGLWFGYSFAKYSAFVQEVPNLIQVITNGFPWNNAIKFLPLFYQLAARVDSAGEGVTQSSDYVANFQAALQKIVLAICRCAPHQTLPVLYALTSNESPAASQSRVEQISDLLARLSADSDAMREHWEQMKPMLDAYVQLAKSALKWGKLRTTLSQLMDGNYFDRFTTAVLPRTTVIT
jgi:hypothetical protein